MAPSSFRPNDLSSKILHFRESDIAPLQRHIFRSKKLKADLLCQGLRNPPGCTCFEVNTDYNTDRMDLESFNNVASPQDCQDLCVKNPDCLFWSYLTTGHPFGPSTCWLKDHILSKQKNDIRKFSGPRICSHLP